MPDTAGEETNYGRYSLHLLFVSRKGQEGDVVIGGHAEHGMIQLLIFAEGAQQNCCPGLPGDRLCPVWDTG